MISTWHFLIRWSKMVPPEEVEEAIKEIVTICGLGILRDCVEILVL